jgi:hypothetical protein
VMPKHTEATWAISAPRLAISKISMEAVACVVCPLRTFGNQRQFPSRPWITWSKSPQGWFEGKDLKTTKVHSLYGRYADISPPPRRGRRCATAREFLLTDQRGEGFLRDAETVHAPEGRWRGGRCGWTWRWPRTFAPWWAWSCTTTPHHNHVFNSPSHASHTRARALLSARPPPSRPSRDLVRHTRAVVHSPVCPAGLRAVPPLRSPSSAGLLAATGCDRHRAGHA